ncbi:hypothetical protein ESY86_04425 [Subsaximicrobium wynnwilliamsii]|uniref:Type IV toxin-antitoxin system AbiEi family antitoxin domain-containing protein n=2 Tax=Subsaximicrobium wynnwilliamsii TaxID=291179 RepID=A0A5C6ZLD4_9FLAO|nr:hypothetical protein ESY87_04205 [Subsaximicrobium wynnwilliamsii]TXD90652.1 hypothetical protein ESY86_04425 [Subsaximicrobium wynnwilliamsii]TXE05127.1 hypothetical protein ESY88_02730 [Subsaximicrobium wynnwilliamsii]
MISIEDKIKRKIISQKDGTLLFPEDFNDIGSSEAVRLALHRLFKDSFITRIAQGIYVRPKNNSLIGGILPTAEEVAYGIAQRDRIKIVPTGIYALHALGISQQIPLKLTFLTDGAPREIQIGKQAIKLKRTTPKNLKAIGKISSLVIQALRSIGKGKVTHDEELKILELLQEESETNLKHDIKLAPVWIKKTMSKALNNDKN